MDFAYFICVSLSILLFHKCFGQDEVKNPSTNFQVNIIPTYDKHLISKGSNKGLTCELTFPEGSQQPVMHWENNDLKITTTDHLAGISIENVSDRELRLRLTNVHKGYEGIYKCVATLGAQSDSKSIQIEVYDPVIVVANASQYGKLHQDGVLSCNATADPAPVFVWKFDNGSYIRNSEKYNIQSYLLTIKDLTFEDSRNYTCDITVTRTGEIAPFTVNYEVIKLPEIEDALYIIPNNPKVGDEVTITCKASGVPEPTYSFKKDGTLLPDTQVNKENGVLTILDLKENDEGEYTCVATNRGGSDEKKILLDVKIPPTIGDIPEVVEAIDGENKQIICEAQGDPDPTISWEKLDGQNKGPNDRGDTQNDPMILNFAPVRPNHAGKYRCTANNTVGSDSKSVRLDVKYKPNFETEFKTTDFYAWEGHTANLTCLVKANEVANIKWFKSDKDNPIETGVPYVLNEPQDWPEYQLSSSSLLVIAGSDENSIYGEYRCEATNSQGTEVRYVRLIKAVVPEEPKVKISEVLSTMIRLEVSAPEENGGQPVLGYYIRYFQTNDTTVMEDYVEISDDNVTKVDLRKLLAKTTYDVKVAAKNIVGRGKEVTLTVETEQVSRPLQLNITSPREGSEPHSYKVVWSEPDDGGLPITKYVIKYKKVSVVDEEDDQWEVDRDEDKEFKTIELTNPTLRSHTIPDLELNSFYDLRISAVNNLGESMEETRIIKTSEGSAQTSGAADGEEENEYKAYTDVDEKIKNISDMDDKKDVKDEKTVGTLPVSQSESTGSASLRSGAVIGIVIGLLILLIIIAVVIFLVFKRKPELVGRLRGLGGKGGEEERGKNEDGKDPAEEEKLIKKDE